MKKNIPSAVINPFSNNFIDTWDLWKQFRKEEHNFTYKGIISEQMALKRLVEVSEGEEEKAVRIVEQSISRGWMDFYQLKQPSANGKSKQKQPVADKRQQQKADVRDELKDLLNERFGGGKDAGGESHLKAV